MKFTVKLSMLALALVQMMICSCAVPDIEDSTVNLPEEGETVFSAVMELTKTLPSAGGVVSWTEDDEIGVYDGTSYVKARVLSVDGGKAIKLSMGDVTTIKKSNKQTQLIRLNNRSFYDVIHNKFSQV